jgi:large subunit ribosomal protein L22
MKAVLTNYRQSPRKVRLVTELVKGKSVERALMELAFLPKRASLPIKKLIDSAVANALVQNSALSRETLFIKEFRVDAGVTLKRMRPRAMGRGFQIKKRCAHLVVTLAEKGEKIKKSSAKKVAIQETEVVATPVAKVAAKKAVKKVAAKKVAKKS